MRYERRENTVKDEDLFELEGLSQTAVGRLRCRPLRPDRLHQVSSDERQRDPKLLERSGVTSSDDFELNGQQRQWCLISEYLGRPRPLPVGFSRRNNDVYTADDDLANELFNLSALTARHWMTASAGVMTTLSNVNYSSSSEVGQLITSEQSSGAQRCLHGVHNEERCSSST